MAATSVARLSSLSRPCVALKSERTPSYTTRGMFANGHTINTLGKANMKAKENTKAKTNMQIVSVITQSLWPAQLPRNRSDNGFIRCNFKRMPCTTDAQMEKVCHWCTYRLDQRRMQYGNFVWERGGNTWHPTLQFSRPISHSRPPHFSGPLLSSKVEVYGRGEQQVRRHHSLIPSLTHPITHSLTHPITHSLTHPPITHSLTHPPITHSLTHSSHHLGRCFSLQTSACRRSFTTRSTPPT